MKYFRIKVGCKNTKCTLHKMCIQIPTEIVSYNETFKKPYVMFIGQGGGQKEEELKRPFVGDAGQRLRIKILQDKVFPIVGEFNYALSNNVRAHPPLNRVPTQREILDCRYFLERDINYLKPKYLIALGHSATNSIRKESTSLAMSTIHGKLYRSRFGKYRMISTYHPSPMNPGTEIEQIIAEDITNLIRRII